jgi:hypothetical protein
MTIATDLRAECARILARNFGLPNELAAIRVSTVARIDAYVTEAEDRAAACTCREPEAFVIPTRRHNGPLDAQFTLARFKRMAAEEGRA